jgi:transposase-like protein
MAGLSKRDGGKERFWRRILRQWRRSGLSVRDFCAEHGLAEPSFYSWRRIVADRGNREDDRPCGDNQPEEDGFLGVHV